MQLKNSKWILIKLIATIEFFFRIAVWVELTQKNGVQWHTNDLDYGEWIQR